jgi:flagellar biosynthesis GTPase FlhF
MIETFQVESMNGVIDFVRIVNGDTATIMTQENYDKQQAEQSTPIVTDAD